VALKQKIYNAILSYLPMAPALNMLSLFEVFHHKIVAEIYGFLIQKEA